MGDRVRAGGCSRFPTAASPGSSSSPDGRRWVWGCCVPGNAAAPYGADGATVPRRSPMAFSPSQPPPCPPSGVPRVPSPRGSSFTHGVGGEGGSEEGTRAGDTTGAAPGPSAAGMGPTPPTPERLGNTDPEETSRKSFISQLTGKRDGEGSLLGLPSPPVPPPPPHSLPCPKNSLIGSKP